MSEVIVMKKEITELIEQGLTPDEAKQVVDWRELGSPGESRLNTDHLAVFYLLGYSCQEINRDFPEYPVQLLLWAKAFYKWDLMKEQYKQRLAAGVVDAALTTKLESIRFLANMIAATHVKWNDQIKKYLSAPDREKAPDCLPNSLHSYGQLIAMLEVMTAAPGSKKGDAAPSGLPSIAIQINNDKGSVIVEQKGTSDVREFMVAEFKKKNEQKSS